MIGGCAQGRLSTLSLQGADRGPAAEATHQHLSESTIQGTSCKSPHIMLSISCSWWSYWLIDTFTILTGPRLLGRDLCRAHQWAADQGVPALLLSLLAGRGLFLLAGDCNTRFIKGYKPSNHIRARIKSHVYTTEWIVYHSTYHE